MLTGHVLHATSQTLAKASTVAFRPVLQKLGSLHFYQEVFRSQTESFANGETEVHGVKWSV